MYKFGVYEGGSVARGNEPRRYETMIVFRADLQEAGTKEQVERARKLLEGNGAVIAGMHEWGLRELAYEIEKERRGYYVLAEYTGTAAAVAELERNLKLSDAVLRFVSVRQEKDTPLSAGVPRDERVESAAPDVEDEDEEGLGAATDVGDIE
jgi:small subunit ribosomal protein S6